MALPPAQPSDTRASHHTSDDPDHDTRGVSFADKVSGKLAESNGQAKDAAKGADARKEGDKDEKKWYAPATPAFLQWIPDNWTWHKWKPVLRCAAAGWLSVVLFLIGPVQRAMGQASFLILIAAFLSPPSDPFMAVLEREFYILLFVAAAWAWSCLAIKLSSLARSAYVWDAVPADVFAGAYIEAAPTVIMAVFLFIGSAIFLYIKARKGPGPFIFATVFGCICLDISMTTAILFPYPYYSLGQAIMVPLAVHSALALAFSLVLFPRSISADYTDTLSAVLSPLSTLLAQHLTLLATPSSSATFGSTKAAIAGSVAKSEGALVPLRNAARLLAHDCLPARVGPADWETLHDPARRLAVRANGLGVYWTLVDPQRERFPQTPAASRPGSRVESRAGSRAHSPERARGEGGAEAGEEEREERAHERDGDAEARSDADTDSAPGTPAAQDRDAPTPAGSLAARHRSRRVHAHASGAHAVGSGTSPRQRFVPLHPAHTRRLGHLHDDRDNDKDKDRGRRHTPHTHALHTSLLQLALAHAAPSTPHLPPPVGVFESARYETYEARHGVHVSDADALRYTDQMTALLRESCAPLVAACKVGVEGAGAWLAGVRDGRVHEALGLAKKSRAKRMKERRAAVKDVKDKLEGALRAFKDEKRYIVLEPYRSSFDPKYCKAPGEEDADMPPHRFLFHCYYYQYHLMRFAQNLLDLLVEIDKLAAERQTLQIWAPTKGLGERFLGSGAAGIPSGGPGEHDDEENPDVVQGIGPDWEEDLGQAGHRDPDALPPKNALESTMNFFYRELSAVGRGNTLFALKAALLTILLCLPSFLRNSAEFAYKNRFVWGIFMGQLTIARFRGDTTFGLVARIMSTFFGGVVGVVIWYISTGIGRGNSYGLAVVCAVCFPFFFYGRLYWPGPPMTNIIFFVTAALVVGYSWQDTHFPPPGSPGWGIDLAYRRFILVTAGVTAAFIFSFLPPSTTLRRHERSTLATTVTEIGVLYCSIISFSSRNARDEKNQDEARARHTQEIVRSLIAIRAKLKRSSILKGNIMYEFSLRGRWPAKRYHKVLEIQLEIAYLLSHLMSAVEQMEPAWSRAFLRRTRFLDGEFQGDVLAVISMISTALRTGNSLPQITPCPLLDRFMLYHHGLNVMRQEEDDDYGLPRTMTMEALENQQYLTFCVGVTTAFNIVTRLDRLMVAVKELVGEQYHIEGLGTSTLIGAGETISRTSMTPRPAHDA